MGNNKKVIDWRKKFFEVKKIGDEPEMNRAGFWKKYEPKELKIGEHKTEQK